MAQIPISELSWEEWTSLQEASMRRAIPDEHRRRLIYLEYITDRMTIGTRKRIKVPDFIPRRIADMLA
jgi:hypothetical protein